MPPVGDFIAVLSAMNDPARDRQGWEVLGYLLQPIEVRRRLHAVYGGADFQDRRSHG